jgi:uncharacterized protein (TIGR04255 family)
MTMFSHEKRCLYRNNQLGNVICQLRFPEILTIATTMPDRFQEAIREDFPQYRKLQEMSAPKLTGVPGNMTLQKPEPTVNHQFESADGRWKVNLTSKFISLSTNNYHSWEDFAAHLDKPLAAFIQIYKPAWFERAGLRYMNFISRKALNLEGVPYRELLEPWCLGPLAEEDVQESACTRSTVDMEMAIRGGCRVKLHAGPGMVKQPGSTDKEVKFVFDQDLFMQGQIPVNHSAGALHTLHSQAYSLFRGAITDKLHEALDPR